MTHRLHIAPTEEAAADLAAAFVLRALRVKPKLVLGLAAGKTFKPVYAALSRALPDLSKATLVQLDEYAGFGAADPRSFRSFLTSTLVLGLPSPPHRMLLIDGAARDPDSEIQRHALALTEAGGLDLQLLGLGMNGHLAFNEPGASGTDGARVVRLADLTRAEASAAGLTPPPVSGLTLGLAEILQARSVLLVVLGARKAAVLARALNGYPDPALPASRLQSHPDLTVIADVAAAEQLEQANESMNA